MPLRLVPQRDRKLNGLFKGAEERTAGRGEVLYRPGDPAEALFLVREGHIRLTLPRRGSGDARKRTVAVAGPWELFGVEALVKGSRRHYGAAAGEKIRVRAVDGGEAYQALRATRRTLPLLLAAVGTDLFRARWPAPGSSGPTTAQRLADLLLELSVRFGSEGEKGTRIPHWFTHRELADLVGAHRSTVTTLLNDWIYDGLLRDGTGELVVVRLGDLQKQSSGREAWYPGG